MVAAAAAHHDSYLSFSPLDVRYVVGFDGIGFFATRFAHFWHGINT